MKIRFVAIFLTLAVTSSPAQSPQPRATLQQSLGFEDQTGPALTGWRTYPQESGQIDNEIAHSGRSSARLQLNPQSSSFSVITRSLPIDFQGTSVELRGYLRLKDVTNYTGLWLRQDADGQSLSLENMQSQQVKGTSDWAQYHITLPLNPKAQQLYFGVLLSGSGTL
ncbi:hypothetical protein [Edaphobacter aggregans]|uniref:hypothetical protein n=1 Tax=Edaphobacter aggregans TaxID=570835 RepID=UPI000552CE38|nr:hypothetical protein [Edaphobacter aggregans]